jgi:hypothetical protein
MLSLREGINTIRISGPGVVSRPEHLQPHAPRR